MAIVWTGELSGNAVIAATDADGNTLWSWHLWITDYDPDALGIHHTGSIIGHDMDIYGP